MGNDSRLIDSIERNKITIRANRNHSRPDDFFLPNGFHGWPPFWVRQLKKTWA